MWKQLYKKKYFPYLILTIATLVSTLILWLPFFLKMTSINRVKTGDISFQTIEKHWDGPLYIIPAKTLYDLDSKILKESPMGIDPRYFAAHLPLYPLTIRALSTIFNYPKAMIFSTLLTSIVLINFFYFFISRLKLTDRPLVLSLVFLFITPRFFITRSVGAPEPLLLLLILSSVFFFIKKNFLLAGIFGSLAVMTKTPGLLLFITYSLLIIHYYLKTKTIAFNWLWIGLIPGGLLLVFLIYSVQMGDFLAYFHSGDNLHLLFPPFSVFNFQKDWVSTGWLEEIIYIYLFYLMAILNLRGKRNTGADLDSSRLVFFTFSFVFFVSIISVQHRDISRYSLPLLPFALISFEKFFTSKKFIIALVLIMPAIYLYAWNFMLYNVAPVADWTPFL